MSHGIGDSYRRFDGAERWDAVVIGSGIGGLTTAVLLAEHASMRVLVLERHYVAGGFTHTFKRPGYEWDVGVHYIGDMARPESATRRLFDAVTGGGVEWAPMNEVYDRVFLGDRSYDLVRGRRAFRDQLVEYFPGEAAAIDGYLARVREVAASAGGYFAEKGVPAPIAWAAGGLMRRRFMRLARRTTRDVLEELTGNQELIAVLTAQFGDYGLPPGQSSFAIQAMIANHYRNGGFYPVGGSAVIAAGAVAELERRGGRVLVSAEVDRVETEGDRVSGVRMADGRLFSAPLVFSSAGVGLTLGKLLRDVRGPVDRLRRRLAPLASSTGHLCLYLGLDRTDAELGLKSSNLWIYPDERHDANIARFQADPGAPIPLAYVSFPSCKDPSFEERYPGRATVEVLTLASYEWFEKWQDSSWKKRGDDYEALKDSFAQRLLQILYRHVPQAEAALDIYEISSPLSTRNFVGWQRGEIYGLDHTPARFAERSLRPRTPIRGFYLTGQDICTCGVAGAMFGGAVSASAALRRPVIQRVLEGAA